MSTDPAMPISGDGPLPWERIEMVVFDLDGTLYRQSPLRLRMAGLLLGHCLANRGGWRCVRTLRTFRRCREELAEQNARDVSVLQYELPAARLGTDPETVRTVVDEWMEKRPLAFLQRYARPGVHELFQALRASGRKVAVLSDHPVERKLAALGLTADFTMCSTDAPGGRLKPNPAGLRLLLAAAGSRPRDCLMVGDRMDRDGEAARRAGAHFLLVASRGAQGVNRCAGFDDPAFAPLLRCSVPVDTASDSGNGCLNGSRSVGRPPRS